jgi:hypothetical protein
MSEPQALISYATPEPDKEEEAELPDYQWGNEQEEWEKDQEEFEENQEEENDQRQRQPQPVVVTEGNVARSGGSTSVGLVEILLLSLIIANGFSSGQFKGLWGLITLQSSTDPHQFRQGFMVLGGEIVALVALSLVANSGSGARKVVLALVSTLWLGWLIHNRAALSSFAAKVQPGKPIKQGKGSPS